MKKIITVCLCCLFLLVGSVSAQKPKKNAPKFSSVYTDLNKACKTIKGENGSDDASDCRGIAGYRIYIWDSASTEIIAAEPPDKTDRIIIATQGFDFDQTKVKLEWRMANGKPFAVILRVSKYGETNDENPYIGKKIGEELVVVGLKGFEKIDFKVDTKIPNANAKARELADNSYSAKK